jgi:hypothetical protein
MATTYEYAKATQPDLSEIYPEVQLSSMSSTGKDDYEYSYWSETDDKLYCVFSDDLSSGDKTIFDAIVAALSDEPGPCGCVDRAYYNKGKSIGLSTTTSSSWQDKIDWDTPWLDAGEYHLKFTYVWSYTNVNNDFKARVLIDDTDEIFLHVQEPKDAGTDQRNVVMSWRFITLTAGVHNIKLQYGSGDGTSTAGIRDVAIEFFEVKS